MGQKVIAKYIGEETPELLERLARATEQKKKQTKSNSNSSRLIRLLRAEGYTGLDAVTGALLMNLARSGVFRLGGTIVGTIAFRLYEGELGIKLGSDRLAQTGDLDIASFERLSLAIADKVTQSTSSVLESMNFDPVPSLNKKSVWRWREARSETLVEFLTPACGDESIRLLPSLGVSAQSLHYLNYLIADPIKAVALYHSGLLVQIPRPEVYAMHKLIVADRRRRGTDELKSRKDLAQADFLIEALADLRPDELSEAFEDAISRGPKWQSRIKASLARLPNATERLAEITG